MLKQRITLILLFVSLAQPLSSWADGPISASTWNQLSNVAEISLTQLSGVEATDPPHSLGFQTVNTGKMSKAAEIGRLVQLLRWEIEHEPGSFTPCFTPRHLISIALREAEYDFLICYECDRMVVYRNTVEIHRGSIWGSSEDVVDRLFKAYLKGT